MTVLVIVVITGVCVTTVEVTVEAIVFVSVTVVVGRTVVVVAQFSVVVTVTVEVFVTPIPSGPNQGLEHEVC